MLFGIIGLGFVGEAMYKSFTEKGQLYKVYDKFKDGGIGQLNDLLIVDIYLIQLKRKHFITRHVSTRRGCCNKFLNCGFTAMPEGQFKNLLI